MADGFRSGYGCSSGVPYPYWLSSPSPHPPASAPPFLTRTPADTYDPTPEVIDPLSYHCSYQRSHADWSNNPSYRDNSRSQTPSFYADTSSRPGNYGPRGEDSSSKDMLSPSGFYSSRESSSDFVSHPNENFAERQRLNLLPTYNSAPVSSYADMIIRIPHEPFFTPITSPGVYASSNDLDENRRIYRFPDSDRRPETMNVFPGSHVDENRPIYCFPDPGRRPETTNVVPGSHVEPNVCVTDCNSSLPTSNLKSQAVFDGSETGIDLGDGRSFPSNSVAPDNILGAQSSLHGSSIEPVNFDVLLGYGEATGHVKPLPENPDLRNRIVGSQGLRSPRSSHPLPSNINSSMIKDKLESSGVSSLYQRPYTLVADSENGVSESSLKNAIEDLNCDEPRSWSHFVVSSEGPSVPKMFSMGSESRGAMKVDSESAQSAVNYKPPFEGSTNQASGDVSVSQKSCKLQEQIFDTMNGDKKTRLLTDLGLDLSSRSIADDVSTGRSPERHLCDREDFPSSKSSPRVSSVINAMHNLSEVLVYECFNNGSWLKLEQLENLDKVVDNLTKCLKKITDNKTTAGEASLPNHVNSPNVVGTPEAAKGVAKGFQGFSVKQLDSLGVEEPVDKNEMTQSIKNILASNFPDGEEIHPQTLLYKNLWLETEAALCSTTCMARYHRIKNEIGNLKFNDKEISADAGIFMQEPSLNPEKSVPIMKAANAEQETTESIIKHGSNCGNNVVTMSHDAPQSSRFNSDPADAVLSLMSRSFAGGLEHTIHGNIRPDDAAASGKIADAIQQASPACTTENKHNDVIDRFQILKQQETERKLMSQKFPDSDIDVIDRFQILKQQETERKLKSQKFPDSDIDVIDRFQILKQQETVRILKTQNCPETKMGDEEENPEAPEMANIGRSSHVGDVMNRFQILKRREAEQVQKSPNSLDMESDSDNDQQRMRDHLWLASLLQIEPVAVDTEPSTSGKGYESPASDWEHVLKDD